MSLFEAIQIVLLAFIAVEIALLRRDMANSRRDASHNPDETGSKGQTINVNVGTPVIGEAGMVAKTVETAPIPVPEPVAEPVVEVPEPIEEPVKISSERVRADAPVRVATSGQIVKKCPSCGMENSSYRTECFNCEKSL